MIVAQEKRKTNIAEYIIYLWQVEDMIRALNFDMDKIESTLVAGYDVDEAKKVEISEWYKHHIVMMQKERIQKSGHLQVLVNLANDLNDFHLALINQGVDAEYTRLYSDIKEDIGLVREKSGQKHHDVEVALNTLYLILMLKMKKQEISEGTQKAVWKFGNFMGHLSKLYKAYESGDLDLTY
ncbi:MAG: DUF4924 family protein [Prolixibacteraceae bacterium]|jgi:hypothetical protein|nr:DUF4924 family protein [Prolixibacteraceae bacterium]